MMNCSQQANVKVPPRQQVVRQSMNNYRITNDASGEIGSHYTKDYRNCQSESDNLVDGGCVPVGTLVTGGIDFLIND